MAQAEYLEKEVLAIPYAGKIALIQVIGEDAARNAVEAHPVDAFTGEPQTRVILFNKNYLKTHSRKWGEVKHLGFAMQNWSF